MKCPHIILCWPVSHAPRAVFKTAIRRSGGESQDILDEDERGTKFTDRPRNLEPQTGPVTFAEPVPAARSGHVLAGETCCEQVNWLYFIIADLRQIPEVRHPGEARLQDRYAVRVVIRNPPEIDLIEDLAECEFDAAVPSTQTADSQLRSPARHPACRKYRATILPPIPAGHPAQSSPRSGKARVCSRTAVLDTEVDPTRFPPGSGSPARRISSYPSYIRSSAPMP